MKAKRVYFHSDFRPTAGRILFGTSVQIPIEALISDLVMLLQPRLCLLEYMHFCRILSRTLGIVT